MTFRKVLPLALLALAACDNETTAPALEPVVLEANFQANTADGWVPVFADYAQGELQQMEPRFGVRSLPAPQDTTRRAVFIAGANRSDDLFMGLTRRIDGLVPGETYDVRIEVEFATGAGSNCVGIGGAPGESVYVKAGAASVEPTTAIRDGYVELTVDKGNQATGGPTIPVIGNLANGEMQCVDTAYRLKQLSTAGKSVRAAADRDGRLWALVGTDSGFEGTTALYYTKIRVTLEP